jgi:hypothetical protein
MTAKAATEFKPINQFVELAHAIIMWLLLRPLFFV